MVDAGFDMNGFPDFMVVGGVKCGTTSLYHYLRKHPEDCVPCKESFLFTPKLSTELRSYFKVLGEDEYRGLFAESVDKNTSAAGEVASIYLYCYKEVIPEIKRILGDIKIIIVLRNPVERAYSHYNFLVRDMQEKRTFGQAVEEEMCCSVATRPRTGLRYVDMGLYSKQVRAYLESFSRVNVILFDDFVKHQQETMGDIYEFLDVSPASRPATTVFNASGIPKNKWLQDVFFKPTPFKMKVREFIVSHIIPEDKFSMVIEAMRKKNLKKSDPIPEDVRRKLADYYQPDIVDLENLIGRDLSAWKTDSV